MFEIKTFSELSGEELYEILRLRCQAFIVEQGGRYQDLDRIDYRSIHIFCRDTEGAVACIRLFPKEGEPGTVQLGRLVVRNRNQGIGKAIMAQAARVAAERWGASRLYLTGRADALGFYQKCGYTVDAPGIIDGEVRYYHLSRNI